MAIPGTSATRRKVGGVNGRSAHPLKAGWGRIASESGSTNLVAGDGYKVAPIPAGMFFIRVLYQTENVPAAGGYRRGC